MTDPVLFPYQTVGEGQELVFRTGDTSGELVLEGQCLRLQPDAGTESLLLVWPPTLFSWQATDDAIQIVDQAGEVVAQVSDTVRLSGGEVTQAGSPDGFAHFQEIIPSCSGPFWLVGNHLARVE